MFVPADREAGVGFLDRVLALAGIGRKYRQVGEGGIGDGGST